MAPFSYRPPGSPTIGARQDLFRTGAPEDRGFFESHELLAGTLWFSRTDDDAPYVEEGFRAPLSNPNNAENLTSSPGTWQEHVAPSPGGELVTFNSSRASDWLHPPDTFADDALKTVPS